MPSSIIDKVNKMGDEDGNQTLKFFDHHKIEYDFFKEEEQLKAIAFLHTVAQLLFVSAWA